MSVGPRRAIGASQCRFRTHPRLPFSLQLGVVAETTEGVPNACSRRRRPAKSASQRSGESGEFRAAGWVVRKVVPRVRPPVYCVKTPVSGTAAAATPCCISLSTRVRSWTGEFRPQCQQQVGSQPVGGFARPQGLDDMAASLASHAGDNTRIEAPPHEE
jgi:hypothetical protein